MTRTRIRIFPGVTLHWGSGDGAALGEGACVKIGDVVRLRSGSNPMTIVAASRDGAVFKCVYTTDSGEICETRRLPPKALVEA